MSTYENITVEEPIKIKDGDWTCEVTWSGPSCRGSKSIAKPRSTHFEAKRDAEAIASRLRSSNLTAVNKGDMPKLPAPIDGNHGDDMDLTRDQASQAETIEADGLARAFERDIQAANAETSSKEEELEAVAEALVCERGAILEKIADLKEQLAKESKEANGYAKLAVVLLEEIMKVTKERDTQAEVIRNAPDISDTIDAIKSFVCSMNVAPSGDIKADLAECLAKYSKVSSDLDAAIKNYRRSVADRSHDKAVVDIAEAAMRHMARAIAELTGASRGEVD